MNDFNNTVKKNLHTILAVIAVIAFIWGILNIFSVFEVNAKISINGRSDTNTVSVSDCKNMDGSAMLYVGNILFGLANLAVAAIGILYFLKITQNKPFYDQYIGSKLKFRPGFLMGAIGAVLQVICYLFCGSSESAMGITAKASIGVSWTTWMMLVIFAGVAVYDKFVLEKQQ